MLVAGNEPRKHHYVPVFYQKHFTDEEGLLWVYDRKLKTYKKLSPKVVCFENDFYTIFSKDGRHLREIETQFTKPLDGIAAAALQSLALDRRLDSETSQGLALFMGLQRTRLPSFRRAVSAALKANVEQFMRLGFSDVRRASQLIARYQKDTGVVIDQTPEALVDAVRSGALTVEPTETGFLQQMVLVSLNFAEIIRRFKWCVLEAPRTSGFISCDDPLVTVPPAVGTEEGVGIATPGSITYFPLTQRFCLQIEGIPHAVSFRKTGAHKTRQVNKNITANSDRFIFGPDLTRLKSIVEASGSSDVEPDRLRVDIADSDADSALVRICAYRRRYFYY